MTPRGNYFRYLWVLLGALGCSHASSGLAKQDCRVGASTQALLVLNSPLFVLYADGTVVYATRDNRNRPTRQLRQTRLSSVEGFMAGLPLDALAAVGDFDAFGSWVTDQSTTVITWWSGTERHQASVYGPISSEEVARAMRPTLRATPAPFIDVYERPQTFSPENSEPYRYTAIDVRVQPLPFNSAERPSPPWPAPWPTLTSPGSVKHEWNYYGDIYMAASCEPDVLEFARSLGTRRTFQLDGTEYLLLTVNESLPSEKSWAR
jgi:hypothetical protein